MKKLTGLRGLKHGHGNKKRQSQQLTQWEEISQADQEMQDIKNYYDRLLSTAAATTNSVYEFSESLKDIGDCLLEKTALDNFDDEQSVKVMMTLGKVQIQLQRLVDIYLSHISQTITVPSESILNELRIVEEMKSQCKEKRMAYEEALKEHKENSKLKSAKVDCFPSQHLQAASDDYDHEVNSLLFRTRSLKKGQCRTLLTQAVRHHAAQISFFKKAYLCLEKIDPYVKSIAKDHHIAYEFRGLEDDSGDEDDDENGEGNDGDTVADSSDSSELSFDHRQDHPSHHMRKSMENVELLRIDNNNTFAFRKKVRVASKSAPLFPDRRSESNFKLMALRSSSSRKHVSYPLPTPSEVKSKVSARSKAGGPEKRYENKIMASNATTRQSK